MTRRCARPLLPMSAATPPPHLPSAPMPRRQRCPPQADAETPPERALSVLVGTDLSLVVIEVQRTEGRVVLSHKAVQAQQRLAQLTVGTVPA